MHADETARLLSGIKDHVDGPVVVIASGDSRTRMHTGLTTLLRHGLTVINPTLTADPAPGAAYVQDDDPRDGRFYQLSPPNDSQAQQAVNFLAPHVSMLYVYRLADPAPKADQDQYTATISDEVSRHFRERNCAPNGACVVQITTSDLRQWAPDLCRPGSAAASLPRQTGTEQTPGIFYADRWDRWAEFARTLDHLCSEQRKRPVPVLADDSLSRFMSNDRKRSDTSVKWGISWYRKGVQCDRLLGNAAAKPLLDQLQQVLKVCDPQHLTRYPDGTQGEIQVGERVPLEWDAVRLAIAVASASTDNTSLEPPDGIVDTYQDHGHGLLAHRQLTQLCVAHLDQGSRNNTTHCAEIFPWLPKQDAAAIGASRAPPRPSPAAATREGGSHRFGLVSVGDDVTSSWGAWSAGRDVPASAGQHRV
jgi:hypothetical protein